MQDLTDFLIAIRSSISGYMILLCNTKIDLTFLSGSVRMCPDHFPCDFFLTNTFPFQILFSTSNIFSTSGSSLCGIFISSSLSL